MSGRPGAAVQSITSASPRVPTSEYARRNRSAAKLSQAASNSRLCFSRSATGRRRQAGSTFKNVNLTTLRFMARTPIYAALIAGLVVAALAAGPAQAQERPRAAIVFWPGPQPLAEPPAIERLAQAPGLSAFGFMSTIQGSYTPEQAFLDMSAGARTTTSLYDDEVPTDLRLGPGGRMSSWRVITERAGTAPADVVPGLLASTVHGAGGHVGYAGPRTSRNREAAVAADRSGRVERVALVRPGTVARAARALWREAQVLVVKLPPGPPGHGQLGE